MERRIITSMGLLFILFEAYDAMTGPETEVADHSNRWKAFMAELKEEIGPYQVLLIVGKKGSDPVIRSQLDESIGQVVGSVPCLSVGFGGIEGVDGSYSELPSFANLRRTTFFLMVHHWEEAASDSELEGTVQLLYRLAVRNSRPRCLLAFFSHSRAANYEVALRYAWQKKFLDVVILEIVRPRGGPEDGSRSPWWIHGFDPFSETYEATGPREAFPSARGPLFPDKLRDLRGRPVSVDLIHRLPYCAIERNATGHILKMDGLDGRRLTTLRDRLNLTLDLLPRKTDEYGHIRSNGTVVGSFAELERGSFDVLGTSLYMLYTPLRTSVTFSEPTQMLKLCALVPILSRTNVAFGRNLLSIVALGCAFVALFRAVSVAMRFERAPWEPFNVFSTLIGAAAGSPDRLPARLGERVVYAAMVAVYFQFSSMLLAELTRAVLLPNEEVKLETLEDLDESGLGLMVNANLLDVTFDGTDGALRRLGRRAVGIRYIERCFLAAFRYKNTSCVTESSVAEMTAAETRVGGEPVFRVLKECFWSAPRTVLFPRTSPYAEKFSDVFRRIVEAGLERKWYVDISRRFGSLGSGIPAKGESGSSLTHCGQLLGLVLGDLVAFLVFLAEILAHPIRGGLSSSFPARPSWCQFPLAGPSDR
ncbi:uncharacterized protein LOC111674144 [Orussus abietinus]|uniref:uncharacterized protein LOC111674144 n=1 Tax=Orussus abietinus TaxID=222816 RepID=UPI000C716249|nr:uncharacterized protein LOC111674144 [Orussus abietinus]